METYAIVVTIVYFAAFAVSALCAADEHGTKRGLLELLIGIIIWLIFCGPLYGHVWGWW